MGGGLGRFGALGRERQNRRKQNIAAGNSKRFLEAFPLVWSQEIILGKEEIDREIEEAYRLIRNGNYRKKERFLELLKVRVSIGD